MGWQGCSGMVYGRGQEGWMYSGSNVNAFRVRPADRPAAVISADFRRAVVSPCPYSPCHQPFLVSCRRCTPAAAQILLPFESLFCCTLPLSFQPPLSLSPFDYRCFSSLAAVRLLSPFDSCRRSTPAAVRILPPFDSFPCSTLAAARMLPPLDPCLCSTPAAVRVLLSAQLPQPFDS